MYKSSICTRQCAKRSYRYIDNYANKKQCHTNKQPALEIVHYNTSMTCKKIPHNNGNIDMVSLQCVFFYGHSDAVFEKIPYCNGNIDMVSLQSAFVNVY